MKILLCGYGNMGKTFVKSFIGSGFIRADDLFVLDKNLPEKKKERNGIPKSNFFTIDSVRNEVYDITVLAVKPQDFPVLSEQIKEKVYPKTIYLSVMAGITIEQIENTFNTNKVIRSMPNLPTTIGQGMTVFSASEQIERKDLFIVQNLISTTGKSLYVENEALINAATAISGSGPAYVFYFMQAMMEKAIELGFSSSEADFLVSQTFLGSSRLHIGKEFTLYEWIERVSSKGGTTEKAFGIFEENKVKKSIQRAVQGAYERAVELGEK